MESLADIFKRIGHFGPDVGHNDKNSTHSYITGAYEQLFAPFRERCDFMEIGLAQGMSMKMWGDYFGSESHIVGADISVVFDPTQFDSRFEFIEADATKPEFVSKLHGMKFDIVIDDGSHAEQDQIATFNLLKSSMKLGAIYCVEDILSPEVALPKLKQLHSPHIVYDLRHIKQRFDDVVIVYQF